MSFEYLNSIGLGTDFIIPQFILEIFSDITFGDIFISLFLLSLICASISTISALMHTIGVAGGYDIYSVFKSRKLNKDTDSQSINLNRATIVIFMVLVVVYCYLMPNDIIAKATSVFMGVTAAALLPAYFYSLYCEKPIKFVAVSSIVVGTVSYLFSALFLNAGTCIFLPICKLITGTNVLFPDTTLAYLDPLMIALPLSTITLVLAILVKKKEPNTMTCNNV